MALLFLFLITSMSATALAAAEAATSCDGQDDATLVVTSIFDG